MDSRTVYLSVTSLPQFHDPIANDVLRMVSEFAPINNVRLISSLSAIKISVEFFSADIAHAAVQCFHNQIVNFGCMKVYLSDQTALLKNISLDTSNLKENVSHASILKNMENNKPCSNFSKNVSSKTSTNDLFFPTKTSYELDKSASVTFFNKLKQEKYQDQISKTRPHQQYESLKNRDFAASDGITRFRNDNSSICVLNQLNAHGLVIKCSGINYQIANQRLLINLFCCCANPIKIWMDHQDQIAFAAFGSKSELQRTISQLNQQFYFGSQISAETLNCQDLPAFISKIKEDSLFVCEPQLPDYRYHRHLHINFNPISKILHLTNLTDNCTVAVVYNIIRIIHEPHKIVKLVRPSSSCTAMLLVEFDTTAKSLEVLTALHNKRIDGKALRVSFSQPRSAACANLMSLIK